MRDTRSTACNPNRHEMKMRSPFWLCRFCAGLSIQRQLGARSALCLCLSVPRLSSWCSRVCLPTTKSFNSSRLSRRSRGVVREWRRLHQLWLINSSKVSSKERLSLPTGPVTMPYAGLTPQVICRCPKTRTHGVRTPPEKTMPHHSHTAEEECSYTFTYI